MIPDIITLNNREPVFHTGRITIALLGVTFRYVKLNIETESRPIAQHYLKLGQHFTLTEDMIFFVKNIDETTSSTTLQFI